MKNRCSNCGSRNHREWDCAKPYDGWREREPAQAVPAAPAAPRTLLGPEKRVAPVQDAGNKPLDAGLDPARWPGGPSICRRTNLPAFFSDREIADFYKANVPGYAERSRTEDCPGCGGTHVRWGLAGDDAVADSSAHQRRRGFPFLRAATVAEIEARKSRRAETDPDALPAKADRSPPTALPRREAVATQKGLF